jgi:hypothetical protein
MGRQTTGIGEDLVDALVLADEEFRKIEDWGLVSSGAWNLLTALDPAADTWAEDDSVEGLGKHAWRLAVLFGCRDVFVTQQDLMALTGLTERPVRRLLDRWRASPQGWTFELKSGRTKVYALGFYSLLNPAGDLCCGHWMRKDKLSSAMATDVKERATAARRGTPEGVIAWRACNPRTRQEFLAELPGDADPKWWELVEAGDEVACYNHLIEQIPEAGSVPSTAEVLNATPSPQEDEKAAEDLPTPHEPLSGDWEREAT